MDIIKVSARSVPKLVAGAIAAVIREGKPVEVQAVGAGAANQAIKAIAISRVYMTEAAVELICKPAFTTVVIDEVEKTAISMVVEALA